MFDWHGQITVRATTRCSRVEKGLLNTPNVGVDLPLNCVSSPYFKGTSFGQYHHVSKVENLKGVRIGFKMCALTWAWLIGSAVNWKKLV